MHNHEASAGERLGVEGIFHQNSGSVQDGQMLCWSLGDEDQIGG